ncbi:hypothetical protein AAFN64_13450 [Flavobacterium sp. CAU 1735]
MKKVKIIICFLIVILITAYFVFIKTDFYMPESKRIANEKGLAASIVNEVAKIATTKDTLFLIVYNPFLICGSEIHSRSPFNEKMEALKYAIKSQYYFDQMTSFPPVYKNNDITIVTGTSSTGYEGCGCFRSAIVNFEHENMSEKNVYEVQYNAIGKDKVEIAITNFNTREELQVMDFVLNANNWILK